ncbi:glycosyltransferase domain-containing protein [Hyphomicrobium sp.]|uniref:glycosyltransferase domain-containing protein n=1 Tax=Hyphomicrobium sp. TaxID=82 RepID=UPI000FA92436|nr:glycosyltransferase domain-containing protein [Hyphomicrobium sp.]RUP07727.1 MAG: DUF616 domain-containing protein [Hyphomicrobium sp.]
MLRDTLHTMGQKDRVIYTCMFGHSEPFADWPIEVDAKTDAICFTDDRSLTSKHWQFRYVDSPSLGPVRTSKMVKILAHEFVAPYDLSLYIDNRVEPKVNLDRIFRYLHDSLEPMVVFRHPERCCIYAEAQVVIDWKIDAAGTVSKQMDEYRRLGHPENAGLIAGSMILRRHNDPRVRTLMSAWFDEVRKYSYRDQLSFNFVARRLGFQAGYFDGKLDDNALMNWPVEKGPRLPRAFNDAVYLALNPDVLISGMKPREHYIKRGAAERRRWRL